MPSGEFADVVPRQDQQADGRNRVDRGPRTTRPRQPERPRPRRAGSAVGEHVLALLAFRSSLDGLRDGSPTRTPPSAALGPRRRASPGKLRDARRVPGSTADCSARLGDDAVAPAAPRGEHAPGAQTASGERGYPRREPAEPPVANAAPEAPSDVCPGAARRRGPDAAVLPGSAAGRPSRQPASRSGRRARAADGCPGGGAGSRGGRTAPATRSDCPCSR
jgi:hypothetical protein